MRALIVIFWFLLLLSVRADAQLFNVVSNKPIESLFNGSSCSGGGAPFTSQIGAVNYNCGGNGIAFGHTYISTNCTANSGYRSDFTNFNSINDSGLTLDLGCLLVGDFYNHTINVSQSGPFILMVRGGEGSLTGAVWAVNIDGRQVATVNLTNTGGYQVFQTFQSGQFNVSSGDHIIQLKCIQADSGGFCGDIVYAQGAVPNTSSVCNSPTVPSTAQSAGFTTLAACYDFSQPKYANQSNYLTCGVLNSNEPSVTTDFWQEVTNTGFLPCDIGQVIDNGPHGDGSTVMRVRWKPGYTGGGLAAQQEMHTKSIFPVNSYVEVLQRTQDLPDVTSSNFMQFGNYTITWDYTSPGVENDMAETYDTGNATDTLHLNPGNNSIATWTAANGFDIRQYHLYGSRVTMDNFDGGLAAYCVDVDGARTTDWTNGCRQVSPTQSGTLAARTNWIMDAGALCNNSIGDASCVSGSVTEFSMLVKYLRVWSCSSWQTTSCANGPVFTNP